MPNWLKLLFTDVEIENRVNLPQKDVELLKKDFEVLEKESPGISERLLKYLLDDVGDEVLSELTSVPKAGEILKLTCMNGVYRRLLGGLGTRIRFFKETCFQDAGFWFRLAQIYGSASQTGSRQMLYCDGFEKEFECIEILLMELVQYERYSHSSPQISAALNSSIFEDIFVYAGEPSDAFVRGIVFSTPPRYYEDELKNLLRPLPGLADSFARHAETVFEALDQIDYQRQLYVIDLLSESKVKLAPFLDKLTNLAVGTSKKVRAAAEELLLTEPENARPAIERVLTEGTASERYYAVKLLWKAAGESCLDFLKQRKEEEKSKKVRTEIEHLLRFEAAPAQNGTNQTTKAPAETFDLPPIEIPDAVAPLPPETRDALKEAIGHYNQESTANWERNASRHRSKKPHTIDPEKIDKAFELLQNLTIDNSTNLDRIQQTLITEAYNDRTMQGFFDLILRQEFDPIHLVRLLLLTGSISPRKATSKYEYYEIDYTGQKLLERYRQQHHPELSLRELAAAFRVVGLGVYILAADVLFPVSWPVGLEWEMAEIWPFFAEHIESLEDLFELRSSSFKVPEYWLPDTRKQAFRILQAFPHIPQQFLPMLWEIALGIGKSERDEAQACLNNVPDKAPRIIAALKDGKKDIRAAAADWLGRLECKEAIPALKEALEKEKHEEPKGLMMRALERLGVPIEQFMDIERLNKDAEKGLKKGIPAKLQWFPFDRLPPVRWRKSGDPVAPGILRWFLLQSFKLKNPEPGPLLRLYCSYFHQSEKETLGRFVLEQWIAEDTKPKYSHEEATAEAEQQLKNMRGHVAQYPQFYPNWNEEKEFQRMLDYLLTACLGSATPSKGILALSAACCNADVVPPIERYLKQWYGQRASQCKSLIQVLAWLDHPSATQLLLSVSNRFRTKSIQQEATKQVQLLAERKGWTMDELADRTIPSAGFDHKGRQELDYGERAFTLSLGEDLKILMQNEEGKKIKSLPQARKSEDPELVKEAKKQLSAARKELKNVLKMQKERLYEAMCVQRVWLAADWQTYLNEHPIVGRYCQQLVWLVYRDDELLHSFRPLADRSLSDAEDEDVSLQDDDRITLAHECLLPKETCQSWLEHFSDYEVAPLFPQFGRASFELTEELKKRTELTDFEGHLLSSFALRGKATKLGYTRSEGEDGGWFYFYRKDFPGQSLRAEIEFTGNGLPEEERTIALRQLFFSRLSPERQSSYSWNMQKLPLGKVPPVLLVECWNDIRSIAAEGSGYDPDWEKKSEY